MLFLSEFFVSKNSVPITDSLSDILRVSAPDAFMTAAMSADIGAVSVICLPLVGWLKVSEKA